jgi:hypothetical protein
VALHIIQLNPLKAIALPPFCPHEPCGWFLCT